MTNLGEPTKEEYEQAVMVHRVEPLKLKKKGGSMIKRIIINYIDKPSETVEIKRLNKEMVIKEMTKKYNETYGE